MVLWGIIMTFPYTVAIQRLHSIRRYGHRVVDGCFFNNIKNRKVLLRICVFRSVSRRCYAQPEERRSRFYIVFRHKPFPTAGRWHCHPSLISSIGSLGVQELKSSLISSASTSIFFYVYLFSLFRFSLYSFACTWNKNPNTGVYSAWCTEGKYLVCNRNSAWLAHLTTIDSIERTTNCSPI